MDLQIKPVPRPLAETSGPKVEPIGLGHPILRVNPAQLEAERHAVDGQHVGGDAIVDLMFFAE